MRRCRYSNSPGESLSFGACRGRRSDEGAVGAGPNRGVNEGRGSAFCFGHAVAVVDKKGFAESKGGLRSARSRRGVSARFEKRRIEIRLLGTHQDRASAGEHVLASLSTMEHSRQTKTGWQMHQLDAPTTTKLRITATHARHLPNDRQSRSSRRVRRRGTSAFLPCRGR